MTAPEKVFVWYDPEGDFLDVVFEIKEGVFEPTQDNRIDVKVDDEGNVLGFHVLGVSSMVASGEQPFEVELVSRQVTGPKSKSKS